MFDGVGENIVGALRAAVFDVANKDAEVNFGAVQAAEDGWHFGSITSFLVRHIAPHAKGERSRLGGHCEGHGQ
jgi:hypothetical protein